MYRDHLHAFQSWLDGAKFIENLPPFYPGIWKEAPWSIVYMKIMKKYKFSPSARTGMRISAAASSAALLGKLCAAACASAAPPTAAAGVACPRLACRLFALSARAEAMALSCVLAFCRRDRGGGGACAALLDTCFSSSQYCSVIFEDVSLHSISRLRQWLACSRHLSSGFQYLLSGIPPSVLFSRSKTEFSRRPLAHLSMWLECKEISSVLDVTNLCEHWPGRLHESSTMVTNTGKI